MGKGRGKKEGSRQIKLGLPGEQATLPVLLTPVTFANFILTLPSANNPSARDSRVSINTTRKEQKCKPTLAVLCRLQKAFGQVHIQMQESTPSLALERSGRKASLA